MRLPAILILTCSLAACGESRGAASRDQAPASEAPSAQPAAAQQPAAPREGILLAFSAQDSGRFTLEPVAIVTPGGLRDPWQTEDDSAFIRRYFAPGTRYAVRRVGSPVGEASVLGMTEPGCTERVARTSFTASGALPPMWEGLASDAFGESPREALMRPLTPDELSELATLADSIHASRMIPSSARAAGENERLFAVTVPGAEGPVLVGTFNVTVPGDESDETYNQMLIVEPRGGVYRSAYVFHDRDDGENGVRSLLDAADLDGDGAPELVVRLMFSEGWGYAVLKRGAGGWTEIYQGGGGGC